MNGFGGELSDGDDRSDQGERSNDGVHAGAIRKPGVHPRAQLVDAPTHRGDDPVDDPPDVLVVLKDDVDPLDLAVALDVDVAGAVDHHLGDRIVEEQRLERPEAGGLVDHFLDQAEPLVARHGEFGQGDPVDDPLDLGTDLSVAGGAGLRVEGGDDLVEQANLDGIQELVPAGRSRRLGRRLNTGSTGRAGPLAIGFLLRFFNPLEQRHGLHLLRGRIRDSNKRSIVGG